MNPDPAWGTFLFFVAIAIGGSAAFAKALNRFRQPERHSATGAALLLVGGMLFTIAACFGMLYALNLWGNVGR